MIINTVRMLCELRVILQSAFSSESHLVYLFLLFFFVIVLLMGLVDRVVDHSLFSVCFFGKWHTFCWVEVTDISFLWTRMQHKQIKIIFILINLLLNNDTQLLIKMTIKLLQLWILQHHLKPMILICIQNLRIISSGPTNMLRCIHINQFNHLVENLFLVELVVTSEDGLLLELVQFRLLVFALEELVFVEVVFLWEEFSKIWIGFLVDVYDLTVVCSYFHW